MVVLKWDQKDLCLQDLMDQVDQDLTDQVDQDLTDRWVGQDQMDQDLKAQAQVSQADLLQVICLDQDQCQDQVIWDQGQDQCQDQSQDQGLMD